MRRFFSLTVAFSLALEQPGSLWAQARYRSVPQTTVYRGVSPVPNLSYPRPMAAVSLSSSLLAPGLSAPGGCSAGVPSASALSAQAVTQDALRVQAVKAYPDVVAVAPPAAGLRVLTQPVGSAAIPSGVGIPWASVGSASAGQPGAPRRDKGVFSGLEKLAAQRQNAAQVGAFFDRVSAYRASDDGMPEPPEESDSRDKTELLLRVLQEVRDGKAEPLARTAVEGREILLIPGLNWDLIGSKFFKPYRLRLEALGFKVRMVKTDPLGSQEVNSLAIRSAIEKSDRPVDIIAASRGGKDLRKTLLLFPEMQEKIRNIVTINAPYAGTPLADWFLPRLWLYDIIMVLGRLLRPWRIFSTNYLSWHEGIRQLAVRHNGASGLDFSFLRKDIGLFAIASRLKARNFIQRLKARIFKELFAQDNDGVVPTAGSILPGADYAVLDDMGHIGSFVEPNWLSKLSGLGTPWYPGFAGDLAEAIVRLVLIRATGARGTSSSVQPVSLPQAQPSPSRFWTAVRFGITVAVLAPVLYHAAPVPTLFYTATTAFALAGLAWLAVSTVRGLRRISPEMLRSWFKVPRSRAQALISGTVFRFWMGILAGLAAPLGTLVAYGVSPFPTVFYIAVAAFSVWAVLRLARRTGRLFGSSGRWLVGEAARDIEQAAQRSRWTRPWAWAIRFFRLLAETAARHKSRLTEPARSAWERVHARVSLHPAALGLVLGFGAVLAVPFLAGAVPIVTVLYGGVMAVGGLWLVAFVAEAMRLGAGLWRLLFRRGQKGTAGQPGRLERAVYISGLLLGLLFGRAPTQYAGPVVEKGFYMGTVSARYVERSKIAMGNLPHDWQAGIRMIAEGDEVRQIRGGAFEEETIQMLSKIPRGRALLDKFRDHGGVIRLPKFYLEDQSRSGAFESPIVHGVFLNTDHVRGWEVEDFLEDEAKQRQLARELWQLSFHELKHTEQSFRFRFLGLVPEYFPGQFDHFPWQVTSMFHMELEYEAHIEDHLAFMEMLEVDLEAPGDDEGLADLLTDLDQFLKGIDKVGAYEAFKHVDSHFFREYIKRVRQELPANGVRGFELLARRYQQRGLSHQPADPWWTRYYLNKARAHLDKARALAQEHNLPPPAVDLVP